MSAQLKPGVGELRPMREADLSEVMAIELLVYPFPWTWGIFRDCLYVGYCCWVYEEDGHLQAYGVMSVGAGEAHVLNLCVRPSRQGCGLGRRLLSRLVEVAEGHRAEKMLLEVRPTNVPACRLYRSLGFAEIGTRKDYYPAVGGREDALIMARPLRGRRTAPGRARNVRE